MDDGRDTAGHTDDVEVGTGLGSRLVLNEGTTTSGTVTEVLETNSVRRVSVDGNRQGQVVGLDGRSD